MSRDGVISSAPASAGPPPLSGNAFYEDAARRVALVLPELPLSAEVLAVIDAALHRERCAWRARFNRPDPRDGLRKPVAAPDLEALGLGSAAEAEGRS